MLASRRRLFARLVLGGFSLALSLLAAELAVRLARPQEAMTVSRGLYVADPPRRYRLAAGHHGRVANHVEFDHEVLVDDHGLRGRSPAADGGPGRAATLRVLALGDSFTFGIGASESETYPARLETRLRAAGVAAEVLNAGAPGYGVPDEVGWYEAWGVPLRPDVVVIAPFLANDLQDAEPGSVVRVVDGELVVGNQRGGPRRWLYYHSHLFRLLKSSLFEGALRERLGLAEPWARRQRRAELALYEPTLPADLAAGASATEVAIARLARLAAEQHARVIAVLVPSLPQVDPRQWVALHRELGVDAKGHDPRRPNHLFAAMFERHGIAVVDPTEALAAAVARGETVYYPRDQHLTPAGYDLLAREVALATMRELRPR